MNSKHYTIQLLAARDIKTLNRFRQKNRLMGKTYISRTHKNGQVWYDLIMGDYATVAQAKSALDNLPAHIKNMKPWIRSYISVQKAVKAA